MSENKQYENEYKVQAVKLAKKIRTRGTRRQGTRPIPAAVVYLSSPQMMNTIFAHGVGIVSPAPHGPGMIRQATRRLSNVRIADENSNMSSDSHARK